MNNYTKPPQYRDKQKQSGFDTLGKLNEKPPSADQSNMAQLLNRVNDIKTAVDVIQRALSDYRLAVANESQKRMDVVLKWAEERGSISDTLNEILQHLTSPGAIVQGSAPALNIDALGVLIGGIIDRKMTTVPLRAPIDSYPPFTGKELLIIKPEVEEPPVTEKPAKPRRKHHYFRKHLLEIMELKITYSVYELWKAVAERIPGYEINETSINVELSRMLNAGMLERPRRGVYTRLGLPNPPNENKRPAKIKKDKNHEAQ